MHETFLGCPIDILAMAETIELASGATRNGQRLQHVALNVSKLVNMRLACPRLLVDHDEFKDGVPCRALTPRCGRDALRDLSGLAGTKVTGAATKERALPRRPDDYD
jgi:hypothetical protein